MLKTFVQPHLLQLFSYISSLLLFSLLPISNNIYLLPLLSLFPRLFHAACPFLFVDLFLYILATVATYAATYIIVRVINSVLCLSLSWFHSRRSHVRLMAARVTYASTVRNANGGSLRPMIGGRCRFEDADVTQDRYYPNIRCTSNISCKGWNRP